MRGSLCCFPVISREPAVRGGVARGALQAWACPGLSVSLCPRAVTCMRASQFWFSPEVGEGVQRGLGLGASLLQVRWAPAGPQQVGF